MAADPTAGLPAAYLEENTGQQLLNAAIAFAVLEPVFFGLFLVSRLMNKTANGLDFWLMPLAFVLCFAHIPLMIAFVKDAGAGRHYVTVAPEQFVLWLKLIFAEEFLYITSVTVPKLAVLALYLRLFASSGQKFYRWAVYAIAVAMGLNIIIDLVFALVTCRPVAFNWDLTIPGGYCGDKMGPYRWISLPNILTDIVMLFLPLRVIWKLQTGRTNKIGLLITFLTGSVGIITSILRFATFFTVDLFADPTFNVIETMTWTCAEPGVYFIAACLPSLRPLLRFVLPKNFTQISRTKPTTAEDYRLSHMKGTLNSVSSSSNKHDGFDILRETDIEVTHGTDEGMTHLVQQQGYYR